MKEGWAKSIFTDVCKVINGRAYSKDEMLAEGKYRLLRVGNFFTNDSWYYSDLELEEDKYCEDGDLLYAWSASFGPRIWHGEKTIYHYHIWKLICTNKIDKHYLCYWLESETFKKQVMKSLHGATMMHVTKAIMEHTQVNYPIEISEQQQIVDFLDAEFAKIDELKNQAEQSLQNAKDLFQAALKEMLTPKQGWRLTTLGEICDRITDGSHNPPAGIEYSEYKMLSSKNVRNDRFTFDNPRYLTREDFERENKRTNVNKGDVLLTIVGAGLGDCCTYPSDVKVTFQRSLSVIKPIRDISYGRFIMYLLQSMYKVLTQQSNGAAQKGIYLKQLQSLEIRIPDYQEQINLVSKLDNLSSKIDSLQSNYTRTIQLCADLKQALLRQVFE